MRIKALPQGTTPSDVRRAFSNAVAQAPDIMYANASGELQHMSKSRPEVVFKYIVATAERMLRGSLEENDGD